MTFNTNRRVLNGPFNAFVVEKYAEECGLGGCIVGIDIYADGTTLARSGHKVQHC